MVRTIARFYMPSIHFDGRYGIIPADYFMRVRYPISVSGAVYEQHFLATIGDYKLRFRTFYLPVASLAIRHSPASTRSPRIRFGGGKAIKFRGQ